MRTFLCITILSLTSAFTVHTGSITAHPRTTTFLNLHPDQAEDAKELEECAGDRFTQICAAKLQECPPKANVLAWCRRLLASDKTANDAKNVLQAKKH
mmetsp:Transcript_13095/g.21696  ORF Transcript_13095/g.21696 Transcript_13095/m.21696 type:complete len:98 (-) Transcript_13095:226-519(-)|eukprot:CAMPEP_0119003632 /NCGR_PEP_ID=MMETSP1176-20130426/678_1 /TAXON_ID=265551 /ORGANISM="Synedropsis recta cf, Strain CCMP1620" /LENGTH=97 /DNA_ID=CAMNT_0006955249 /DNA_START=95 /DNA_END=388 /DNA_ORIENTATION=-